MTAENCIDRINKTNRKRETVDGRVVSSWGLGDGRGVWGWGVGGGGGGEGWGSREKKERETVKRLYPSGDISCTV